MKTSKKYSCGCVSSRSGLEYCQDHSGQMGSDTINRFYYPEVVRKRESRRITRNRFPEVREIPFSGEIRRPSVIVMPRHPIIWMSHPLAAKHDGSRGMDGFFLIDAFESIFNAIMDVIHAIINLVVLAVKNPFQAFRELIGYALSIPALSLKFLANFPLTRWLYVSVNYITGGLLDTVVMTLSIPGRLVAGKPVSRAEFLQALLLVMKVAAVVLTGGATLAIVAFAADALKKGPLGDTVIGRTLLDMIVIGASIGLSANGFTSLFEKPMTLVQAFTASGAAYAAEQKIGDRNQALPAPSAPAPKQVTAKPSAQSVVDAKTKAADLVKAKADLAAKTKLAVSAKVKANAAASAAVKAKAAAVAILKTKSTKSQKDKVVADFKSKLAQANQAISSSKSADEAVKTVSAKVTALSHV